jgi:nitrogen fixation-related uncharacterized protein
MDPVWAAPISTLIGAISTAILMWATYRWPRGRSRYEDERDELEARLREEEED